MKRFSSSSHGVTLLEIMLVLAIAAMIIVMSIRYYQSAHANQQANALFQQLTAITSAADSLSLAQGNYSNVKQSNIQSYLGSVGGLVSPWDSTISVSGSGQQFTVNVPSTPAAVCGILIQTLGINQNITNLTSSCSSPTGSLTYTYNMTPQPKST